MTYRMILIGAAVGALGAASLAALDLTQPDDAIRAMRKLQCHLDDGEPIVYGWSGRVYSRVPGERDRMLFTYEGMNVRACATVPADDGYAYRMVSREVLIYTDPKTGEIVRNWSNPWTGEEVEVVHIANDPVNFGPIAAHGPRGDFRFNATFQDGKGWMSIEVPLFYPNPLAGAYQEFVGGTYHATEMFNFYFDEADLHDDDGTLDDVMVSWARIAQWLPWMRMGSRAGVVYYNGAGKKLRGYDDLPKILKDEIAASYPIYTEPPPLDDDRRNETSWTYFKKWIDARREPVTESSGH